MQKGILAVGKFLILFLFIGGLNAQDTSINKAGIQLKKSKDLQILSLAFSGIGVYALTKQEKDVAKGAFIISGLCEIASITYYYKGCQFLIKANGITVKF